MLSINIPEDVEFFNEDSNEFVLVKKKKILLEHSLFAISEWESRWEKPFYGPDKKTNEEIIDYIRCMNVEDQHDISFVYALTNHDIDAIKKYINSKRTATTFSTLENKKKSREIVTSELIYYWMIQCNIPTEYQYWHINRLMTLIEVCRIKNTSSKKMSKRDIMSRNAALNAARRKKYGTKG